MDEGSIEQRLGSEVEDPEPGDALVRPTIAHMVRPAESGIVHLRVVVPSENASDVAASLEGSAVVVNVIRLKGASVKPPGDLLLCDVAREEVSVVVEELRRLDVDDRGSISIDTIDTTISRAAMGASDAAPGSPSDAVIWEQVEARTSENAELSLNFIAFMVLATLIAAVGILTDSQVLIIGAMVVGPEFGPLAGLCVALVQRRFDLAGRSGKALAVGFPVAIGATYLFTIAMRSAGIAPDAINVARPATIFISHPDAFSVVVALLAGIAGLLSLTTSKSGALMGVLISVTTIPAAANVGAAAAYSSWSEVRGALAQLGLNLACIVVGGLGTLVLQRSAFRRRLARA